MLHVRFRFSQVSQEHQEGKDVGARSFERVGVCFDVVKDQFQEVRACVGADDADEAQREVDE